uniref:Clathrin/coatomer adaptor adaptin-like N-terminal domain-containing protein n=1 Tax=Panagrolaimus superbus TaxID=310955 RepID=A0A914YQN0_9BILA
MPILRFYYILNFIERLKSPDIEECWQAASELYMISKNSEKLRQTAIDAGVITEIGKLLDSSNPDICKLAIYYLSLYSFIPNHAQLIVEADVISKLINLSTSSNCKICNDTLWALESIIKMAKSGRKVSVKAGILTTLINPIKSLNKNTSAKAATLLTSVAESNETFYAVVKQAGFIPSCATPSEKYLLF